MDLNLGPSCCHLGAKLVQVGPKLGPCWPKLTPSRADVAAMSGRNGAFGQSWADLQNAQSTAVPCTLWRHVPGEHAPPQLKLHQTDRSVHSYRVRVVTCAAVVFLCRKRCAAGKSMICHSYWIAFSNTLQGHRGF